MSDRLRVTGLNSGMDTESIVSQLVAKYQTKIDTQVKKQKKLDVQREAWKDINSDVYSFYTKTLSNMRWSNSYSKMATKSSSDALKVTAGSGAVAGIQSAKIVSTAKAGYITGGKVASKVLDTVEDKKVTGNTILKDAFGLEKGTYQFNGKEIEIDDTTTISGYVSKLNEAGVTASFDETQQRFYIAATGTGTEKDFDLSADKTSTELLELMNMTKQYTIDQEGNYYKDGNKVTDADEIAALQEDADASIRVVGADAKLMLNGTMYTSNDNAFTINGLTLTIEHYSSEEISIATSQDTDGVYDSIKSMISEYNNMINKMLKMYNQDSEKYEPLTDEEADALSDTEREKWDTKVKESALYKDARLAEIMRSVREVLNAGVEMEDGTKLYLSNFGIATKNYFEADADERYALHIDGDSEDEYSGSKTDKLKCMIATDPEKVQEFFSKLSASLYKRLTDEMSSTSMSSIYKIYNDKQLDKDYKNYDTIISELEEKMSAAEDKYYEQFARMEKAMGELNSKQSVFSSYLG